MSIRGCTIAMRMTTTTRWGSSSRLTWSRLRPVKAAIHRAGALSGITLPSKRFMNQSITDIDQAKHGQDSQESQKTLRLSRQRLEVKKKLASVPDFSSFVGSTSNGSDNVQSADIESESVPYVDASVLDGDGRSVFLEVYGCQMNVNDTEIAWAILKNANYVRAQTVDEADVVLMVTCAIREGAERKVFTRLAQLAAIKRQRRFPKSRLEVNETKQNGLQIGVLGCMAERLKTKLLETEKSVDLVVGPDAYRDLPRLLALSRDGQAQINVQLSLDETYADVSPIRMHPDSPSAYLSIMRGCDNMCSYCIVPFTRGRERSRDQESIINEAREAEALGIREITLLGQNVNSYRDLSIPSSGSITHYSRGFTSIYKPKEGGRRFAELIYNVAEAVPNVRLRFTSPHPKDFPDELLHVIRDMPNVCKNIHLPAQSGSSAVLERMRRGYTRESYLKLVSDVRSIIPDVSISTDMIAGFCGETELDHRDSVELMKEVRFNQGFLFAYSMRAKTNAYHKLNDDVPQDVKSARLNELIRVFQDGAYEANQELIGKTQTVLVEGTSRRSSSDLAGRTDGNIKSIFALKELQTQAGAVRQPVAGDIVAVRITSGSSMTLKGEALKILND